MAIPSLAAKVIPSQDFTKGKPIGKGGYGTVYLGKWHNVSVAIKELFMQSALISKTFEKEASVMAECNHPNIVRLFGVCLEEGKLAFLMEYLEKGSLYDVLQNVKVTLLWSRRFVIAADVGNGLSYLHSQNIIHRDLKSLNILIAKDDTAKITDFGLAKVKLETGNKTTGIIQGSIPWVAPELISEEVPASTISDIYSFGMVLWEIASRRIPFSNVESTAALLGKKFKNTHETIPTDCPSEYAALIQKCWAKPSDRPKARVIAQELSFLQEKANEMPPLTTLKSPSPNEMGYLLASTTALNLKSLPPAPPKAELLEPISSPGISNNNLVQASPTPPIVNMINNIPSIAFGKAEWAKYFGDIGIEPLLPPNIEAILQSPCPFWPGKKVQETHLLVLIPQTVNGKPLTLRNLGELVKSPKQGPKTQYRYFDAGEYNADTPAEPSHWVLMTRDVIPNKSYTEQQKLASQAPSYQVPKVVEAATCIFMEYMRTNNRLYNDNPWTWTRCQEKYGKDWQLVVGGFSAAGLDVHFNGDNVNVGVAGLRKFF